MRQRATQHRNGIRGRKKTIELAPQDALRRRPQHQRRPPFTTRQPAKSACVREQHNTETASEGGKKRLNSHRKTRRDDARSISAGRPSRRASLQKAHASESNTTQKRHQRAEKND
jgi:hypothetical protein